MAQETLAEAVGLPRPEELYPDLFNPSVSNRQENTGRVLLSPDAPYNKFPINAQDLVGVIQAGNELFGVVRASLYAPEPEERGVALYLLTRFSPPQAGSGKRLNARPQPATLIGMLGEEPLIVGRESLQARGMDHPDPTMSWRHFAALKRVGFRVAEVGDFRSTNGTVIFTPKEGAPPTDWAELAPWYVSEDDRVWASDLYRQLRGNQHGVVYYPDKEDEFLTNAANKRGIPTPNIILHDTPVSGRTSLQVEGDRIAYAVTVAAAGQESEPYMNLFEKVRRTLALHRGRPMSTSFEDMGGMNAPTAVTIVGQVVEQSMQYSQERINALTAPRNGSYTTIDLETPIEQGVGVCHEQALAAAKLIEMLQARDIIGGEVHVRINHMWQPNRGELAGHVWAWYTDEQGEIYIIDPTHRIKGRLIDILEEARARKDSRELWHYLEEGETLEGLQRAHRERLQKKYALPAGHLAATQ